MASAATSFCGSKAPILAGRRSKAVTIKHKLQRTKGPDVRMEAGGSFPEGLINRVSVAVTNFAPANAVKKGNLQYSSLVSCEISFHKG